jgi:replicative DNA helicase
MPLHIDDTTGLTAMALRAKIRKFAATQARTRKPRPRLVVVDYLQLMRATSSAHKQGREREVAELAQELKEIAGEFALPVVALSQMNRSIEQASRRPRLSDLRESGNIEQAADNVIFIHDTKERGLVEFIVEKQRNGPNDVVLARFDREYTRFSVAAEHEETRTWHDREDAAQ